MSAIDFCLGRDDVRDLLQSIKEEIPTDCFPLTVSYSGEYPDSEDNWGIGHQFTGFYEGIYSHDILALTLQKLLKNIYIDVFCIYTQDQSND